MHGTPSDLSVAILRATNLFTEMGSSGGGGGEGAGEKWGDQKNFQLTSYVTVALKRCPVPLHFLYKSIVKKYIKYHRLETLYGYIIKKNNITLGVEWGTCSGGLGGEGAINDFKIIVTEIH